MSNYLKIIFKCDLILQKFLYFRGEEGNIFRSMEKIWKKKHMSKAKLAVILTLNFLEYWAKISDGKSWYRGH